MFSIFNVFDIIDVFGIFREFYIFYICHTVGFVFTISAEHKQVHLLHITYIHTVRQITNQYLY